MVYVENFTARLSDIPVDKGEVLRYCGAKSADGELSAVLDECIAETERALSPKLCYCEYPLSVDNSEIDLGFCRVVSRDLLKNLSGCDKIVVFVATVGISVDRLIMKYNSISPSKALCISAVGSERIEALCDAFCSDLEEKYGSVRPRFSAGYGDLDLSLQRDIFNALGCAKNIGVSLGESLLMTPVKSVTAIVGIKAKGGN